MSHYNTCRKNMIDCQIAPAGVVTPRILDVLARLPREDYMPATRAAQAYVDEDVMLGNGVFMMEPAVLARMIDAAAPRADDIVLNIGDGTGYSSAVVSSLAMTVVTVEPKAGFLDAARAVWARQDCNNIITVVGNPRDGASAHAPYSLIFFNGSVAGVPESIIAQLAPQGRLIAPIRARGAGTGYITLIERTGQGSCAEVRLFNAATPYLPGFEPQPVFVF